MAAIVHGVLSVTGLVTGYTVDALRVAPELRGPQAAVPSPSRSTCRRPHAHWQPPVPGDLALALRTPVTVTPALSWLLACCGFLVAFPTAFQMVDTSTHTGWSGGAWTPTSRWGRR